MILKDYKSSGGYTTAVKTHDAANGRTIVFLHTAGNMGDVQGAAESYYLSGAADARIAANIVIPASDADDIFWPEKIRKTLKLLNKEGIVNMNKVAITGISMGGRGTFDSICHYPELFKAAAPISGFACYLRARRTTKIPIWCLHGKQDGVVPIDEAEKFMDAHKMSGAKESLFTEVDRTGHELVNYAYRAWPIMNWLFEKI